jgi:NADPH2:quinone reductase
VLALTKKGTSVALTEVPNPVPLSHEAIVRVKRFCLNRRELLDLAQPPDRLDPDALRDGSVLGWDFAGELEAYPAVINPTAKATPVQGARVFGTVRRGAWAQWVAVPYTRLALTPDNVADVQASALPTPGLAALRALELGGFLVGKRVMVIGARGAVGRLACQLANLAGAHVRAVVRPEQTAPGSHRPLDGIPGAHHVTDSVRYLPDLTVDTVGGAILGEAVESLEPQGLLVTVATPDRDGQVSFRIRRRHRSAGARIQFLGDLDEVTAQDTIHTDLKRLIDLVAAFKLDVGVEVEESWRNAADVVEAVLERQIKGRAVLRTR